MEILFCLVGIYFLCSVPFGVLIAVAMTGKDPRNHGSGNIGMTNVWRVMGFEAGLLTLIADLGKGFLSICLMQSVCQSPFWTGVAACIAVLGHCYSAYLNFSGGKGVATTGGVLLACSTWLFLLVFGVWILVRAISKKSSLAALSAASISVPLVWFLQPNMTEPLIFIIAVIVVRHKDNISRLRLGKEHQP